MLARFLLVVLLSSAAYAETRTYVVYRWKCFPNDKYVISLSPWEVRNFIDVGKKDISQAKGQPFRITSYELNYNGKYGLLRIDDELELDNSKNALRGMKDEGCAKILSSMEAVEVVDERIGGKYIDFIVESLDSLPTDYYQIDESSGT